MDGRGARIGGSELLRLRTLPWIRCGRSGCAESRNVMVVFTIGQISQTNPHVVVDRPWNGNCDADAQDGMGHCWHINVAIVQKDLAGSETPDQR